MSRDNFWPSLLILCLCLNEVQSAEPQGSRVPLGLDEFIPTPDDNPSTPEKIEIGRQLFFDKRLSRDGTVACATCHIPERAFADGERVAVGVEGRRGTRNVPTLLNRAYGRTFFWDGRATALEQQPPEAILNPKEMDLTLPEFVIRLNASHAFAGGESYSERLHEALGQEASVENAAEATERNGLTSHFSDGQGFPKDNHRESRNQNLAELDPASRWTALNAAKAIAAFVRTLLSANSPFDRFEHGEPDALSESARRGLQIFRGKGNCIACHSGPLLSDEEFHNTGVSWGKEPLDLGRFEITRQEQDRGKFKTPSLRNVALTSPYMHDGSLVTLEDVVEFYSKGGAANPHLDPEIRPLPLSSSEKADLLAFLKALSSDFLTTRFP